MTDDTVAAVVGAFPEGDFWRQTRSFSDGSQEMSYDRVSFAHALIANLADEGYAIVRVDGSDVKRLRERLLAGVDAALADWP